MTQANGPLRIGIGGPVGSGKTTLTEKLCKALRDEFSIAIDPVTTMRMDIPQAERSCRADELLMPDLK